MENKPGITWVGIMIAVALGWCGAFLMYSSPVVGEYFLWACVVVAIATMAYGIGYKTVYPFIKRKVWKELRKK